MIEAANEFRNRAGIEEGHVVTEADASLVASIRMILAAWLLRHEKAECISVKEEWVYWPAISAL